MRLSILGAGAWGTALAIAFAREHHEVRLWARETEHIRELERVRENRRYLPDAPFPDGLKCEAEFEAAIVGADLVLIVTPMSGLRDMLLKLAPYPIPFLWACKGFEHGTGLLPHQLVLECAPNRECGMLSGPSFAKEVAQHLPAALTLASESESFAQYWASALHVSHLRVYPSTDVIGVEVGAAVKNVLAIASGVVEGLELGLNARAALLTRGLAEMSRLATAMGGRAETLAGLSGVGDLVLTCTGALSRNFQVGRALASGRKLPDILADLGHVAEGVLTAAETLKLANRFQVDMPITECVVAVLDGRLSLEDAVQILLERAPRSSE